MQILFSYLKQYRWFILLTLLLASINQVFSLFDPMIFQKMLDTYVVDKDHKQLFDSFTTSQFLRGVGFFIGLSLGVAMVSRIAKNFQDYFLNVITQKLGAQIYSDGLKHSLELPYSVFEDQRSGETLGKLQKVRSDTEKLIFSFVNILFTTLIGIVFVFWYSFSIYWLLPIVYFTAIPLLALISSALSRNIKKVQKKIVSETTALAGSTTESLRNIELIKSLGLGAQEITRLNNTTFKILLLELKKVRYIRSMSFVQGTFVNLLRNAILFLLIFLIFRHKLSVGQLFSMQIYSFFIFGPLQELGNLIGVYRETEVSLNNFQDILNTPKEEKPGSPIRISEIDKVEFKNVSFKHRSSSSMAVDDISFHVERSETVAFVGPSGSGKTTLVKLLVGLYQPASGEIFYNGIQNKNIDLDELRNQMGLVTQDTQLFSGTIKENLLFVAPTASDKECMDVLLKASCQNLLARADKGLDTMIGEGGVKVSGGEKQRLSIARALLRKPKLIVFDEATSALDSLTEEEISSTIREVSKNTEHITIMIAHRLSTIMHADRIYVLEHGKVIESGKHHELTNLKGLYYAMWRQQIGERKPVIHSEKFL